MKAKSRSKQPDKKGKQNEGAPPWSKAIFQELADNIIDGIYCINTDGYIAFVNRAIIDQSGISPDKFYTSHFLDIVHPAYRDLTAQNFQRVMSGENGIKYELGYDTADGETRIVEVHSKPIRTDGKVAGLLGIARNITERKQVEKALQESEEKYRSVVETTRDMIYATDRKGFLTYINPTLEKILGYTKDEWNGKSFAQQIVAPEYIHKAKDIFRRTMHGESIPVYEIDLIRKDGTRLSVEVNASTLFDQEGKPAGRYGIGRDITERKQAEEALKASEQKYSILMENASDAILLADMQGRIIEANRKAEELLGWTKEELLQMHYTQLRPVTELERTIAAFQYIIEKNTGHLSGGFIQRKDGNIVPVDITCNVIEYTGRKVVQGSFRDFSEHRQTQDILEKLVRERTAELARNNEQLELEIKERKHTEAAMKKKSRELKQHTDKLNELNSALRVLLKQREDDKNDLEEKVTSNVKELLLPYIEEMKNRKIDSQSKVSLSILETNLQNIISPFTQRLSSKYLGLTPREVQVADLIRQGKSTKEIARFIGISASAISIYRYHIREKLGLIEQKINLKTSLQSLS